MKLSVFGLGKLGVPMLATFAKKQFKVVGYDINQSIVDRLNKGLTHVEEPGLTQLLKNTKLIIGLRLVRKTSFLIHQPRSSLFQHQVGKMDYLAMILF